VRGLRLHAEQALLGAVLSDPVGQAGVLDLVTPGDMSRPWHGQVLAAMQRLRRQGQPADPAQVRGELLADPDLPRSAALDAVPLAGLMEASPRPRNAPAYAALVIEGSIRDRVGLAGSRITQAAGEQDPGAALLAARQARQAVRECQARWHALPATLRHELPVPASAHRPYAQIARQAQAVHEEIGRLRDDLWTESPRGLEERLARIAQQLAETAAASATLREHQATRRAAAEVRPQGPAAHAASLQALRDLAAAPDQIDTVQAWLRPGHFAQPEHGDLYSIMRDLRSAGKPADPVTVSWEAARRGIHTEPAYLSGGNGALAVASARELHRLGLLAHAAATGRHLQDTAADPAYPPRALLRSAAGHLSQLEHDAHPAAGHAGRRGAQVITMPRHPAPGARPARAIVPGREAAP